MPTALLHPLARADETPDKPALIVAETGQAVSYAELAAAMRRGAVLLRELGLTPGALQLVVPAPEDPLDKP